MVSVERVLNMLNLTNLRALVVIWVLILLAGCDSEPAKTQSVDTSQIDEVRMTNNKILDARKTRCDDLLLSLETSEMSQKMWHSLKCPAFYTELAERANPQVKVAIPVPEEPVPTRVQSGEIDFGGALQNISKVLSDNQPDGEPPLDGTTESEE